MYRRSIRTPLTAAEIPAASFGAIFPGSYCSAMWFLRFARSAAADTGIHVYMQEARQSLGELFMNAVILTDSEEPGKSHLGTDALTARAGTPVEPRNSKVVGATGFEPATS